jgi:hypothetical protein
MQSGSSAQDKERFANARAEWWVGLRTRFESGDIDIPDDEELITQLAGIRYKINSRGQILIESKDDMKRRGISSPDRADALMLVFGAELDGAAGAMFSSSLVDLCAAPARAGFEYKSTYHGCLCVSGKKDNLVFGIGHVTGGTVVIDQIRYWLPKDNHPDWTSIAYEIRLLCLAYRVEGILHNRNTTEMADQLFTDFLLNEIPTPSEYRMKIYNALEDRMKQGQVRYPDDERLLQEFKALRRTWTGDKFAVHPPVSGSVQNDEGPDVVANLVYQLYHQWRLDQDNGDVYDPRYSNEWPETANPNSVQGISTIAGGQAHF